MIARVPEVATRLACALACLLASGSATAQPATSPPPERAGPIVRPFTILVGLERLAGVSITSHAGGDDDGGACFSGGGFAQTTNGDAHSPFYPHAVPRLGGDVVLGEQLTLGVAGGLGRSFGSLMPNGDPNDTRPTPAASTYVLAARAGYVDRIDPSSAFWGRVGLWTAWGTLDERDPYSGAMRAAATRSTGVSLEAQMLLFPARHVAITMGLVADVALGGSRDVFPIDAPPAGRRERRLTDGDGVFFGVLGVL